jgi:glyoxylase-like metal-dependent hydrolase (beta-lactamase superfamily II)
VRIGELEILPVLDGAMLVPPSRAYAGVAEAAWAPHRALLDADGMVRMELGGFLVRGATGSLALIDCGLGRQEMGGRRLGGALLDNLAAQGVSPDAITDVIFTHLHLDHIGWASDAGAAVFPNATYRCDQRDWDFWITTPPDGPSGVAPAMVAAQQEVLQPVAQRMVTWSADGAVLPGLNVVHAPGHTPGSAIVVLSSGDQRAMLLGDVVHCPVELLEDEWNGLGDVDPALARRTRNALARELEGTETPVAAAHFPGLQFGRLLRGEGQRRWVV